MINAHEGLEFGIYVFKIGKDLKVKTKTKKKTRIGEFSTVENI